MASVPLKPQYGPTLGTLLAPRWHAARPAWRVLAIGAALAVLALAVGLALNLLDATYSHGQPVPFGFKYKGLYRTTPDPGGYVKVAHSSHGRLEDSYAVAPLHLGAYERQCHRRAAGVRGGLHTHAGRAFCPFSP